MSIPAVIYTKLPIYLSLLFDGLAVMLYQFLISFNTTDHSWFFGLSLPITALCTLATILFAFCLRKISSAFFDESALFFSRKPLCCAPVSSCLSAGIFFTSAAADLVGGRLLRLRRYRNLADYDSLPMQGSGTQYEGACTFKSISSFLYNKKNVPWHIFRALGAGVYYRMETKFPYDNKA